MSSTRAKWTRSRTGCWTCRKAGYKCDETRPECGRCKRLSITCSGYGNRVIWRDTATVESGTRKRKRKTASEASPGISEERQSATPSALSTISSSNDSPISLRSHETSIVLTLSPGRTPSDIPPGMGLEDYQFLHHWTTVVSPILSVASKTEHNPFREHLTPMTYNIGPLRYTVLFCAAKHLSALHGQQYGGKQILRYQNLALRHLNEALGSSNEATSDSTLASVLLMQLSTLFASDEEPRADHLNGAKWIITKRRGLSSLSDSCGRFLESLFRYHDVMSSITRGESPLLDHQDDLNVDGDEFLGDIAPLLEIISHISMLQPRKQVVDQDLDDIGHEDLIESVRLAKGMELETQLKDWTGPSDDPDWLNLAEAFRHAAFIYLYRVIYNIGAPHPLTLQHAKCCLDAVRLTPLMSPLVSVHVWPIFTAGCESIDPWDRAFCRQRLQDMFHKRKLLSLLRVQRAMEDVWSRKDQEALHGADQVCRVDCIAVLKQKGREVELG
ncbi:fungal-specific transcription factor domain-containing protein [Exophiala viscosa]|uniref:fungal-specific transcription factor domain-containing protein n=1 Tax=Exophiala viscosa TaxID=2486360 RepID=UPI0021906579|nr:fungal-specific transcription factor domain-containing protein [Exophiala viscosa]